MAKRQVHVEERLLDNDRASEFPPELGKVYRCAEEKCAGLVIHAHTRRPYLIYDRSKL